MAQSRMQTLLRLAFAAGVQAGQAEPGARTGDVIDRLFTEWLQNYFCEKIGWDILDGR